MVDYSIDTGIVKIGDKILVVTAKNADEEWFAEDITILLSSDDIITTVVADFSYDTSSIIQYTLNSGAIWNDFNNGTAIVGGQSRFIRLTTGVQLNFRARSAGNLNRCVVSVP